MTKYFAKIGVFAIGLVAVFGAFRFTPESTIVYDTSALKVTEAEPPKKEVLHLETPEPLKAAYMSACYASMPNLRSKLVKLVEETELNALVIDVKDYTGTVSFDTGNLQIDSLGGSGCKVADMAEFLAELHSKDIYTIADTLKGLGVKEYYLQKYRKVPSDTDTTESQCLALVEDTALLAYLQGCFDVFDVRK